jgi:hypothetical protein
MNVKHIEKKSMEYKPELKKNYLEEVLNLAAVVKDVIKNRVKGRELPNSVLPKIISLDQQIRESHARADA